MITFQTRSFGRDRGRCDLKRKRPGKKRRGMSIVKGLFLWTFLLGASFVVGMFIISPLFYSFGKSKSLNAAPAPAVTVPSPAQSAQQPAPPSQTSPPPQQNVSSGSDTKPLVLSVSPVDSGSTSTSSSPSSRGEVQSPSSLDTRASRRWQERSQPTVRHVRRRIHRLRRRHPRTLGIAPSPKQTNSQGAGTENPPVQSGTGF